MRGNKSICRHHIRRSICEHWLRCEDCGAIRRIERSSRWMFPGCLSELIDRARELDSLDAARAANEQAERGGERG